MLMLPTRHVLLLLLVFGSTVHAFVSNPWHATGSTRVHHPITVSTMQPPPQNQKSALRSMVTDASLLLETVLSMPVPQVNTLITPIFIASALPYAAFVYGVQQVESFPKGATVGLAWVLLFGGLAGPIELFTQQQFAASFFDCDWVHGTVSSIFATGYFAANCALWSSLSNGGDGDQASSKDYGPSLRLCTAVTLLILAVAGLEFQSGFEVHSPHWYGKLDCLVPPTDALEPSNALSVATWFNHVMEISQFQLLMRFVAQWTEQQEWLPEKQKTCLVWGLVPLQVGNIFILTFHLFYNQLGPLYLLFAILLLVGNCTTAWAVWQMRPDSTSSLSLPSSTMVTETPAISSSKGNEPGEFVLWSLGLSLVAAYGVKYGSLLVNLPMHVDLQTAALVILPACWWMVHDVHSMTAAPSEN